MRLSWFQHDAFELAYLAQLTRAGLKPVSRWEKRFDGPTADRLQAWGLQTRVVERALRNGTPVRELLFSTHPQPLDEYASYFDGRPVGATAEGRRLEGKLFGYPRCCVDSFVARGYVRNALRRSDQRILFHWACPGCALTPRLLPPYRNIYRECRRARVAAARHVLGLAGSRLPPAIVAAATVLTVLALPPGSLAGPDPATDPHQLPLTELDDADQDFLTAAEEAFLGWNPTIADENQNQTADGVDLAGTLARAIDRLPTQPSPSQLHVAEHLTFGEETCQVCGAAVNMGFLEVVRPLENQSVAVPCIAKHYLDHGSFSYAGSVHSGRLNVALLHTLLAAPGAIHLLPEPAGTDTDEDGLQDKEEPALGTSARQPDTDGDQLVDGVDVARELRARLDALPHVTPETAPKDRPYIIDHPMDGIEICPRCGESVVMDIWDVIHPVAGTSIRIPSMALHHLAHGGFGWKGGQLEGGEGRVDPVKLQDVLNGPGDGHQRPAVHDADRDFLVAFEEAELGCDPANADQNGNQVPDGVDLAREAVDRITQLPTEADPQRVYRRDFMLRGVERCDVCGIWVNMGHLTVCNPVADLYCKLPYVALHYLEHGAFAYAGDVHGEDRLDVGLLLATLNSTFPAHRHAAAEDADGDGLSDAQESLLGSDPRQKDTDGDGVPDGFDLARGFWRELMSLPRSPTSPSYVVEHWANGIVACSVCGTAVNMGFLELVNRRENRTLPIPFMLLHYLQHGAFAVSAGEHVDPVALQALLRPVLEVRRSGSRPELRWFGTFGHHYQVSKATDPLGPWEPGPLFVGQGNELMYADPAAPPGERCFYRLLAW